MGRYYYGAMLWIPLDYATMISWSVWQHLYWNQSKNEKKHPHRRVVHAASNVHNNDITFSANCKVHQCSKVLWGTLQRTCTNSSCCHVDSFVLPILLFFIYLFVCLFVCLFFQFEWHLIKYSIIQWIFKRFILICKASLIFIYLFFLFFIFLLFYFYLFSYIFKHLAEIVSFPLNKSPNNCRRSHVIYMLQSKHQILHSDSIL